MWRARSPDVESVTSLCTSFFHPNGEANRKGGHGGKYINW